MAQKLSKEAIERMEGLSNIDIAIKDLLDDGFSKKEIIKYVAQFKRRKY